MIGASSIGSDSVGSFTNNFEFASPASSQWKGVLPIASVRGDIATSEWVGVDSVAAFFYEALAGARSYWNDVWILTDGIWNDDERWLDGRTWNDTENFPIPTSVTVTIDPAVGEFIGADTIVDLLGESATGLSWSAEDGLVTLVIDPATGQWVGKDSTATASGTASITATGATGEWVGVDSVADYDVSVEGIPDIIVNRSGSTVTIKIRNMEDKEATIYKATASKATYSTLATITSSSYEETSVTGEPKYKASFTFSGNIGGSAVTYKGVESRSRYTKD